MDEPGGASPNPPAVLIPTDKMGKAHPEERAPGCLSKPVPGMTFAQRKQNQNRGRMEARRGLWETEGAIVRPGVPTKEVRA